MSVTATAKRRRRQAKNGYKHLAPKQRPNVKVQKRLHMQAISGTKGVKKKI